jgi:hypothetical protein
MNDSGVHGATVTQFIDTLFQFTFLQLPPLYLHGWVGMTNPTVVCCTVKT